MPDGSSIVIDNLLCLPFISSGVHQERRPVAGTGDGTIFAVRRA